MSSRAGTSRKSICSGPVCSSMTHATIAQKNGWPSSSACGRARPNSTTKAGTTRSRAAISNPSRLQRPFPAIMNAGGSERGRRFAAQYCDIVYTVLTSTDFDDCKRSIEAYRKLAFEAFGRDLKVWSLAYVVQGETEAEARAFYDDYVDVKGDWAAANNVIDTMGLNAKTIPPERLQAMKERFCRGMERLSPGRHQGPDRRGAPNAYPPWDSTAFFYPGPSTRPAWNSSAQQPTGLSSRRDCAKASQRAPSRSAAALAIATTRPSANGRRAASRQRAQPRPAETVRSARRSGHWRGWLSLVSAGGAVMHLSVEPLFPIARAEHPWSPQYRTGQPSRPSAGRSTSTLRGWQAASSLECVAPQSPPGQADSAPRRSMSAKNSR